MPKYDDFDLDIQVKEVSNTEAPSITSVSLCTPGTCYQGCSGDTTFNSNCCPSNYTLCITKTCFTCA